MRQKTVAVFFFPGRRYSGTRQKYSIRHAAANFFQSCGSLVRQKSSAAFFSFFSGRRYSGTRQKKLRQWSFSGSSNDRFQKLLVIVSGLRR